MKIILFDTPTSLPRGIQNVWDHQGFINLWWISTKPSFGIQPHFSRGYPNDLCARRSEFDLVLYYRRDLSGTPPQKHSIEFFFSPEEPNIWIRFNSWFSEFKFNEIQDLNQRRNSLGTQPQPFSVFTDVGNQNTNPINPMIRSHLDSGVINFDSFPGHILAFQIPISPFFQLSFRVIQCSEVEFRQILRWTPSFKFPFHPSNVWVSSLRLGTLI